jgi:uncharacterized protein YbaR (Trm112 family)
MVHALLDLLRCPFCGAGFSVVENEAHVQTGADLESGVLGCECCAFPVVSGIPVLIADDLTREAMHALEGGHRDTALAMLLGLDEVRSVAFRSLMSRRDWVTYRDVIEVLSPDAEGTYFIYRFSDPTFLMAEAVVRAVGRQSWALDKRVLDLCGGSGHLTRVLTNMHPAKGTVLADVFFWKLWLAARFTAPGCAPVCCDANNPLPFVRDMFSMVVLSDAFPYIWQKRLLAEEMMRLTGVDGAIVMPHLHSALGENFSAGMTLTPTGYGDLFRPSHPRLFSDERLLSQVIEGRPLDLAADVSPGALGTEPSLTLIACHRADVFRVYDTSDDALITGELKINPLYRRELRGATTVLTLSFPTREYEEEFAECRRYLPDTITVNANLSGRITPELVGDQLEDLCRRRVLIDAPAGYLP